MLHHLRSAVDYCCIIQHQPPVYMGQHSSCLPEHHQASTSDHPLIRRLWVLLTGGSSISLLHVLSHDSTSLVQDLTVLKVTKLD